MSFLSLAKIKDPKKILSGLKSNITTLKPAEPKKVFGK